MRVGENRPSYALMLKQKTTPGTAGGKKDFSKGKTGELKASPKGLKDNQTSKYNSSGLAAALLKYKEVQF